MHHNDNRELNLLSLCHYIAGGVMILIYCMPLVHVLAGMTTLLGDPEIGAEAPNIFEWIFVVLGLLLLLMGMSIAICMMVAGHKLKHHTSRHFCMAVAGVECVIIPLGTILGIITILELTRDPVKELFKQQAKTDGAS